MPKAVSMVLSLSLICLISGVALGGLYNGTKERIDVQILQNMKMPAVEKVMADADNNLLDDRRELKLGPKDKHLLFPAKKGSDIYGIALESSGKGFGGDVGVMIGFDTKTDDLIGIGITTMSETPGVGTRAKNDSFLKQFKGMKKDTVFKVKADGGQVDAVSGATVTSRAVCEALRQGTTFYKEHKDEILKAAKQAKTEGK